MNIIIKEYQKEFKKGDGILDNLSKRLGMNKTNICRKAKQLGLTNKKRICNESIKKNISKANKGNIPWNKNKKQLQTTGEKNPYYGKKHAIEERKIMSKKVKEHIKKNGHPKGFLGHKHTIKSREKMSKKVKNAWKDPNSKMNTIEFREKRAKISSNRIITLMKNGWNPYSNARGGKREDIGIYVRSKTEANYIRYLNFMKIKWEYEPKIFYFEGIKRGTLSYTPDIYLPEEDKWIEIKGWFTKRAKVSLKRFKRQYPIEFQKLIIVIYNPWGRTKSDAKAMEYLEEIGIGMDRIESYKEIKDKLSKLISNWE